MITSSKFRAMAKSNIARRGSLAFIFLTVATILSHLFYSHSQVIYAKVLYDDYNYNHPIVSKASKYPHNDKIVIFPRQFHELVKRFGNEYDINLNVQTVNFTHYYQHKFKINEIQTNSHIIQYYDDVLPFGGIYDDSFKNHTINFYNSTALSHESSCQMKTELEKAVQITNSRRLDNELNHIVKVFKKHLETDPAFSDINDFIMHDLDLLIEQKEVQNHFSKFAGTSVWLEQFGVHFMVSRVAYSQIGIKDKPIISLVYAQIFDEHWNELKDVELIMPSLVDGKPDFKRISFPSFLPIPFFKGYHQGLFYGPEDPRMILVRNSFGFEEPLMVFNSRHRKIAGLRNEADNDDSKQEVIVDLQLYRSMFLCYPFQYDYGIPVNINGIVNPKFESILFSKVITLERLHVSKRDTEKNWTPFVNIRERTNGADTHIYFVYRWANMEILKCDLNNFNEAGVSNCESYYQKNHELDANAEVGDLRGGSELIHLNQFLPHLKVDAWFGLARAHLMECGCGYSMYRPNLAVIIKDEAGNFEISYLSSFVSFDVPVEGFNDVKIQCDSSFPNALIPNGISNWIVSNNKHSHSTADYLTLSFSVADSSNHIVTMKNFLRTMTELVDNHGSNHAKNDNVVNCALTKSGEFCSSYASDLRKIKPDAFNY